jgi:ribonuclease P protein component
MDRLRQRADFLAVANGARANGPAFVVQGRRRDDDGPVRIGFTVTKKNGNAPQRNRIRRRLRELVKRLDVISMRPHHDYVLVGRQAALTRDFAAMLDDLGSALRRLDRQPKDHVTTPSKALPSGVGTGSRQETRPKRQRHQPSTELNDETLKR